jgi:uncharacterized membrane protein
MVYRRLCYLKKGDAVPVIDIPDPGSSLGVIENIIFIIVQWIRFAAESLSIIIITVGIIVTLYVILTSYRTSSRKAYNEVRFTFSRYLVMALEFELAADIIGTAISPTWDQLGKLAVIATIRTFLNYFLQMEMMAEKKVAEEKPVNTAKAGDA